MPNPSSDSLLNIGFKDIATWTTTESGALNYTIYGNDNGASQYFLNEPNALYAFVISDRVMYIGKTTISLRRRFIGYQKPGPTQSTNIRCNKNIKDALGRELSVRIYVFCPISHLRYGDFDLNIAAGLEDSLIRAFDPPWNGSERGRRVTEETEREAEEEVASTKAPAMYTEDRTVSLPATDFPIATFSITLADTYYDKGLINPGVAASQHLGAEGQEIIIRFANSNQTVKSRINRTANNTGAVRIIQGGSEIARWFQANFQRGDIVQAHILSANTIMLLPKL